MNIEQCDAVAIGRFDGLHLGHRALFGRLWDHGALVVIDTGRADLTPPDFLSRYTDIPIRRYQLSDITSYSPERFLALLRGDFPSLRRIVVGEDFRFAQGRSCDAECLRSMYVGETVIVPEVMIDGQPVHSRHIRTYLLSGDIARANRFFGREYRVYGRHIPGQGLGSRLFVPTINVDIAPFLAPAEGVYVTRTTIDDRICPSVTCIGRRVSTDGQFAVETHLLDVEDERLASTHEVAIQFLERIRENRFYPDPDDLRWQIMEDIQTAKRRFAW